MPRQPANTPGNEDNAFEHIMFDVKQREKKIMPCLRMAMLGGAEDDRIPVRITYDMKKSPKGWEFEELLLQIDEIEKSGGLPRHTYEEAWPDDNGEALTHMTRANVGLFAASRYVKRLEVR